MTSSLACGRRAIVGQSLARGVTRFRVQTPDRGERVERRKKKKQNCKLQIKSKSNATAAKKTKTKFAKRYEHEKKKQQNYIVTLTI